MVFYDWETCKIVRKIDIIAKKIYWNEVGSFLTIVTPEDFYVLSYNKAYVTENLEKFEADEGDEQAFTLLYEVLKKIVSKFIFLSRFMKPFLQDFGYQMSFFSRTNMGKSIMPSQARFSVTLILIKRSSSLDSSPHKIDSILLINPSQSLASKFL